MQMDSPEDRLLRLIKGKYKKKGDIRQAPPGVRKPFLTGFIRNIFLKNKIFKPSFLKPINNILLAILIALSGYLAYTLLFSVEKDIDSLIEERSIEPKRIVIKPEEKSLSPQVADYSDYLKEMKGKKLFSPPPKKPGRVQPEGIDIAKRFSLVGIIAGVKPQAIIEDRETQKTHYLYQGQSFNGVTVREIGDGKAVLDYEGNEIMLVL